MSLKFGLVGTGSWARAVHAPALVAHDGVDFVGVWGRDLVATGGVADAHGVHAAASFHALIEECDAVALAVSPGAQPELAQLAAAAGCHLILEKPVGVDTESTRRTADALMSAGVVSTIFLSRLWDDGRTDWLREAVGSAGAGARIKYSWLSSALKPGSPASGGWRKDAGAILDVAPHILPILGLIAGPIQSIAAVGRRTATGGTLRIEHVSGATSEVRIDLAADVSFTQERITSEGLAAFDAWSNTEVVDFAAAYRGMLDDFLGRIRGESPTLRGEAASAASAVRVAALLETVSTP
jgi:predicted dehydrogenase